MCDEWRHCSCYRRCSPLYGKTTTSVGDRFFSCRHCNVWRARSAYELACLGETSTTWEALGHACIEQGDFVLAKKCFSRVRDVKYLNLIANCEVSSWNRFVSQGTTFCVPFAKESAKRGETKMNNNLGDYYAYSGRFADAARNYQHAGAPERAMTMFSDLRMFDQAKVCCCYCRTLRRDVRDNFTRNTWLRVTLTNRNCWISKPNGR